jgi:hypothetical protein
VEGRRGQYGSIDDGRRRTYPVRLEVHVAEADEGGLIVQLVAAEKEGARSALRRWCELV